MKYRQIEKIDRNRLADRLWELVRIPSPTGKEREAALCFGRMAEEAGADVTLDDTIPESPSVIARLKGSCPGKTLQLAGHLDHISVPHEPPERTPEYISGRGSADMKCGLSGMLEILQVFRQEADFSGELLVTAYGLHEAPRGDSSALLGLLSRGIKGDAALVFEGPRDGLIIKGKGQAVWDLTVERKGDVTHELFRNPRDDVFLPAALDVLRAFTARPFSDRPQDPDLGSQSLFVGQVHYGDFYNRMPVKLQAQGTARWNPDTDFSRVKHDLDRLISVRPLPAGISAELEFTLVGEAFSVDPEEDIVQAYTRAYTNLYRRKPKREGVLSVLDTSRIVPAGKIPAIPIGYDLSTAHSNKEYILLDRVMEGTMLAAAAAAEYLGHP
ncbi:MAG: M20 family metallopeptidase [Spirochaetia bacterium]